MDIKELIKKYLAQGEVMQLATVANGKPWVCTVHFDNDEDLNLYWVSATDCRHSEEISKNAQAAVAMAIKTDWPVVGLQFEGEAGVITDVAEAEKVVRRFAKRHNRDDKIVTEVLSDESPKRAYKFKPTHIQLFDPQDFPGDPKQQWHP